MTNAESKRLGHVYCPKCGGDGGIDATTFGDYGWHPCYRCGTTGFITRAEMATQLKEELPFRRSERDCMKYLAAEKAAHRAKYHDQITARIVMDALFPDNLVIPF